MSRQSTVLRLSANGLWALLGFNVIKEVNEKSIKRTIVDKEGRTVYSGMYSSDEVHFNTEVSIGRWLLCANEQDLRIEIIEKKSVVIPATDLYCIRTKGITLDGPGVTQFYSERSGPYNVYGVDEHALKRIESKYGELKTWN